MHVGDASGEDRGQAGDITSEHQGMNRNDDPRDKPVPAQPLPSAVALHYDGKGAPRVTAKGRGLVAENILALAEQHGIPLREDPDLVNLLVKLDLGDEIPAALYVAVAEVIAFAYRVSGKVIEPEK
jgi:flagellar biosynthesis protein